MAALTLTRPIDSGVLAVPEPFDLAVTLGSGQVFRWRSVKCAWYGGIVYGYPVMLSQGPGVLRYVCHKGQGRAVELALHNFFRLDDDLLAIYREISDDPKVVEAVNRYRGLRLIRQDPWECLASFVCSSVSNIPRINKSLEAVATRYGVQTNLAGLSLYAFPTPYELISASEGDLRSLGLGFRAKYFSGIVSAMAEGVLSLDALKQASYGKAKAELMALPGIGEKVANCILVFSLDKLEAFPIDRWVRRCLKEWYFECRHLDDTGLLSWAQDRWGMHAGYVQQYLFQDRRLRGTAAGMVQPSS